MNELSEYKSWAEEIDKWQNPFIMDEKLPEWYKFTLFNELYFLVAGGTIWTDGEAPTFEEKLKMSKKKNKSTRSAKNGSTKNSKADALEYTATVVVTRNDDENMVQSSLEGTTGLELSDCEKENSPENVQDGSHPNLQSDAENVGKFLYLLGVEYIMWNTYDVHIYASFALLDLFPKIELSIQRDFARAVLYEDSRKVKFMADGNGGICKVKGAVPHYLGTHDPWHEMNAYNIHDTSKWKDLNPKFVLQVYRDFAATGDMAFGREIWPAVCAAMDYMEQFDSDDDGVIENDGFPDQTYDAWTVHGISAYCGCLWLASLQAAATIAHRLGDHAFAEKCTIKFLKAKQVLVSDPRSMDNGRTLSITALHAAAFHLGCNGHFRYWFLDAPKVNVMERIYISPLTIRALNDTGVKKIPPKSSCFSSAVFHCDC